MWDLVEGRLWRQNFIEALYLLGCAVARLPIGAPDPVLCGPAAVELYTGGLWSRQRLVVRTTAARVLAAELFAVGFRPRRHLHESSTALWHRTLRTGIDLAEHQAATDAIELDHVVRVAIDPQIDGRAEPGPVSVKVVSIEDLIVDEIVSSLSCGHLTDEVIARIRVLHELGCEGVGGEFRADILHRRLASVTEGAIVFDWNPRRRVQSYATGLRAITLDELRQSITIWRRKCGFPVGDPDHCIPFRNFVGRPQESEGSHLGTTNIIPFTTILTT